MKTISNFIFYVTIIYVFLISNPISCLAKKQNYLNRQKNEWLTSLLSRTKRSIGNYYSNNNNEDHEKNGHVKQAHIDQRFRPCPRNCNCNYDTVNCNDLIETCEECTHWSQIDFNQIIQMKPMSFKDYHFSPNRTTHIIIYKLLNSTIGENTFNSFSLSKNSQVEITFQYNSLIKFDKNALNGLIIESNSTLIFNFPYTTQVIFLSKCFDGVHMKDHNSKLIIRILKSFSVRFVGDFNYYYQNLPNIFNLKNTKLLMNTPSTDSTNNLTDTSATSNSLYSKPTKEPENWSLSTGQFIIDIKSTHLVKFEEFSFSYLNLKSNAKFYIDLELIEKLMIQRYAFSNLNLDSRTRMVFYSKQITFIDFKAYSFSNINLLNKSKLQIYLEELTSSLCLQRNVFSNLRFHYDAHLTRNTDDTSTFNFSVINSKNVQIMHDSFSNVIIDNPNSRLFVGVFNMPSYLLLFQNENYYKLFLSERLKYLWPLSNLNGVNYNHQYSGHYVPQPLPANSEYFYNQQMNLNNGINSITLTGRIVEEEVPSPYQNHKTNYLDSIKKIDLTKFYMHNKQSYSYNFSIEKNCFSNLSLNFNQHHHSNTNNLKNIWIIADNIHTLFIDNFILNYSIKGSSDGQHHYNNKKFNNINFILNLKHFVLSKLALNFIKHVNIEFIREPRVFKFGLLNQIEHSNHHISQRVIKITGLDLNTPSSNQSLLNDESLIENTNDYYADSFDQENVDFIKSEYSNNKRSSYYLSTPNRNVLIDGYCQLKSISSKDTIIEFIVNDKEISCSCQTIFLLLNQIKDYTNLNSLEQSGILPCKINDFSIIKTCTNQFEAKCGTKKDPIITMFDYNTELIEYEKINESFLKDYIKFWEYCISEVDPLIKGHYLSNSISNSNTNNGNTIESQLNSANLGPETGNYFYNNFNDIDGLFSASLSLSSSFYEQSIDTQLKPSISSPSSASSSSSSQSNSLSNGISNNIGKIVGIVILCSVFAIILFMVAINIIQYKFRNDLLDDLDYSSQNMNHNNNSNNNANQNGANCAKNSCTENDKNSNNNNSNQVKLDCIEESLIENLDETKMLKQNQNRNKIIDLNEITCYNKYMNENDTDFQEQNESDSYFDDNEDDEEIELDDERKYHNHLVMKKYDQKYPNSYEKNMNMLINKENSNDDFSRNISRDKMANDSTKSSGIVSGSSNSDRAVTPPNFSNEITDSPILVVSKSDQQKEFKCKNEKLC